MKLTKSKLNRLIKEELQAILNEQLPAGPELQPAAGGDRCMALAASMASAVHDKSWDTAKQFAQSFTDAGCAGAGAKKLRVREAQGQRIIGLE
jgi:hypothetical protein